MTIEAKLDSIDASLKLLVTIMQSAGVMTGTMATAEFAGTAEGAGSTEAANRALAQREANEAAAAEAKAKAGKGKGKKDNSTNADPAAAMGLVTGDPEGTRYWVSESLKTVYAQNPGDADPTDQSFKIETAVHYETKKAEFAKKSNPATGAQTTANAKTPAQDSAASSASSGTPWDSVMAQIKALNAGTAPGQGRDGVLATLKHFGMDGKKVPELATLGKNDDILAFVNGLLNPTADSDDLGI